MSSLQWMGSKCVAGVLAVCDGQGRWWKRRIDTALAGSPVTNLLGTNLLGQMAAYRTTGSGSGSITKDLPSESTSIKGQPLHLSVGAPGVDGTPACFYQWYREGVALSGTHTMPAHWQAHRLRG